jgi:transposase
MASRSWTVVCGVTRPASMARVGPARGPSGCGSRWSRRRTRPPRTKDSYLAAQYARLRGRRGPRKAALAVAHAILVIAWHLLSRGEPYIDLGADDFVKRQAHQAYRDRLVRQLERMGHKVTLEPTAA